jgi:transcriptional regulator with XRE-family HTH domain
MHERPEQPPEGALIGMAQKRSPLSARKAAEMAGLSEGRWRQIVSGYQTVSKGVYAPVHAPAETLARMARAVGVTPEQLEEAGRADAAAELRRATGQRKLTTEENLTEMEKALTRIEKALDARDGERQERQRRAVIEALRAIIEDSASSNGSS